MTSIHLRSIRYIKAALYAAPVLGGALLLALHTPSAANLPSSQAALPEVTVAEVIHRPLREWQEFSGRLQATLPFACAKHQVRSHLRQSFGHLPTQSNRAAGDDGHAAAKIETLPGPHAHPPPRQSAHTILRAFISYVCY